MIFFFNFLRKISPIRIENDFKQLKQMDTRNLFF